MMLLSGEDVMVLVPSIYYDGQGDEAVTYGPDNGQGAEPGIPVANVLFGRPQTAPIEEAARYHGATVAYTLGFPASFSGSLRGCRVKRMRDGAMYEVSGDPQPLPPELCPTTWNREVEVTAAHG